MLIFGTDFHEFPGPWGGGPEGFKWHLKSCSLLLVSGVLLARARGSKVDPILVQNRGQKPPRSRPDGFESCLQYGCDFSANFESCFRTFVVMTSVILSGGVKMRDEHGMLREVYISGHDFCHTFRWYENEGRAWNA